MAYNGFLIKVGDYIIPFKYMKADSYTAYRSIQDLDSYRDANGQLHRTALSHVPNKVEFETPPMLTDKSFADLMSSIQKNYINSNMFLKRTVMSRKTCICQTLCLKYIMQMQIK